MNAIRSGFSVRQLFSAGEVGVWYDPSDLTTMYQDSAGTTPVTAVEQPVGLILDKSKGLVLGAELVTNGTFDTDVTGWSASGGGSSTASLVSNRLVVTTYGALNPIVSSVIPLTIGKTYLFSWNAADGTATSPRVSAWSSPDSGALIMANDGGHGDRTYTFVATTSTMYISLLNLGTAGQTTTFDNISVKELPGYHATQATSASRPTLSARVNLLTKTEQFDNAVWTKSKATITTNAIIAPDGALTADSVTSTLTATDSYVRASATLVASASYKVSFRVKKKDSDWFNITVYDGAIGNRQYFNVATGDLGTAVLVGAGFSGVTATITSTSNGFYVCSIAFTLGAGTAWQTFATFTDADNNGLSITAGKENYIWGASLVPADQASLPYQRVDTSTDYDTVGFKTYLKFDGVDDSLATASIDFSAGDKMTVVAGVRKLSDAATGAFVEHGVPGINPLSFNMSVPRSSIVTSASIQFRDGTNIPEVRGYIAAAPVSWVIAAQADYAGSSLANEAKIRVNTVVGSDYAGAQASGNFGNYPLYIGRRAGTSSPFNGHLYSLIVRGAASTDAQIVAAEKYVGTKTGISL